MPNYVVVGSGLAGYGAVRELRRLAPGASIDVVTADDGHFYSKPAISTALAKGKRPEQLVTMPAAKMVAMNGINLHARTRALAIDVGARLLRTDAGTLPYDALVLATGATPIRPTLLGDAADAPLCVNSLDDYERFRARLVDGASIAIIGAGLVGSEFANDLSQHGHAVTLIDPLPTPLGKLVPQSIGETLRDGLARQGVRFHLGDSVGAIDHAGERYRLTLSSGTQVEADLVLSAIGLRPEVALARSAGLIVERGIVLDAFGRTSDPAIFALGDCAQYPHGTSAYVTPIMTAARAIAATATGAPTSLRFPALSVQVKTTACPLVLLPPSPDQVGTWKLVAQGDGEKYLFVGEAGNPLGYAMTGAFCSERADLDRWIMDGADERDAA